MFTSEYNDFVMDNYGDNLIKTFGGNDTIVSFGGKKLIIACLIIFIPEPVIIDLIVPFSK